MRSKREFRHVTAMRRRQIQVAISFVLATVCAFCLLKYLWWASVYSGQYGLPSAAALVAFSGRRALIYLWIGLFTEGASIVNLIATLGKTFFDLSGPLRTMGRGIVAIAIAGFATCSATLILVAMELVVHKL